MWPEWSRSGYWEAAMRRLSTPAWTLSLTVRVTWVEPPGRMSWLPARSRAGNTGGSEASDGGSRDNARHMDDDRISSSLQANVGSTRVAWALRRSAGRGGHPVAEHRHRRCRSRIHVPRNPVTGLGSTDQFPMELGQYNRGGQDTRVAAS